MAEANPPVRTDRTRYHDINKEPDTILPPLPPITPQTTKILSLRQSIENIQHLISDLQQKVEYCLKKCQNPKDGLSSDQSAALYLYSLQWPLGQPSLYDMFNRALRSEDRTKLIPYHGYYNLFMSALTKLPPISQHVWRGVNADISKQFLEGTIHVWWGASSCTGDVKVTDTFLDQKLPRTLFSIRCYNGRSIVNHSYFSKEKEIILAPGTYLKVESQSNPAENLYIVQCEQIQPVSDEELTKSLAGVAASIALPGTVPFMKPVLYLMWLDPNMNKSQDNLKTREKLGELFSDDFQAYEKLDECEVRAVVIRQKELIKQVEEVKEEEKQKQQFTANAEEVLNLDNLSMTPISGFEKEPLVPLEKAIQPLLHLISDLKRFAYIAKQQIKNAMDGLVQDELASIMLYTMEWEPEALYSLLNKTPRSEDRQKIKPFISYLKLFLTTLHKLPSYQGVVWRGVKADLYQTYQKGQRGVWWGFSTTTTNAEVLQNEAFLGQTGSRTLFSIECKNGKQINKYSSFPSEEEVLLLPGFHYEVVSVLQTGHGMHLLSLKEINLQ